MLLSQLIKLGVTISKLLSGYRSLVVCRFCLAGMSFLGQALALKPMAHEFKALEHFDNGHMAELD